MSTIAAGERVAEARRVTLRLDRLQQQLDAARHERMSVVAELIACGFTHPDVAAFLGISKQRVGQLVSEARAAGIAAAPRRRRQ